MAAKIQQWNHLSIMCFLRRIARCHCIHPVGLQEVLHQLRTTSLTCRAWLHSNNKWSTVSPGLSHRPQIFCLPGICLANNALIGSLSCRANQRRNLCLGTILLHHIRMVSLCTCWCCSNHEYPLAGQYSPLCRMSGDEALKACCQWCFCLQTFLQYQQTSTPCLYYHLEDPDLEKNPPREESLEGLGKSFFYWSLATFFLRELILLPLTSFLYGIFY